MKQIKSTLSHIQEQKQRLKKKPQTQSINKIYEKQDGSLCNYCHKGRSYTWSLTNQQFDPYTYQILMQRGWRRCGTYYYKPDLIKSCCKLWTHRLDINQFKIKKDQKKTVKKIITIAYQPIIPEENYLKSRKKSTNNTFKISQKIKEQLNTPKLKLIIQIPIKYQQLIKNICQQLNNNLAKQLNNLIPIEKLNPQNIKEQWNFNFLQKLKCFVSKKQVLSDYYCNYGMLVYGSNKKKFIQKDYQLHDFIRDIKSYIQKLVIPRKNQDYFLELQRGGYLMIELSKKLKQQKNQQFQVIKEIQNHSINGTKMQIQQEKQKTELNLMQIQIKEKQSEKQMKNQKMIKKNSSINFQKLEPQFKGQLTITSDKIKFGNLTIQLVKAQQNKISYELYQKYCVQIHDKSEKSFSSYTNFLCLQALTYRQQVKQANGEKFYIPSFDSNQKYQKRKQVKGKITKKLGCYHMKYYLENKFIGVGVVDLLPHGLSSVYYFYDPQYKDKRMGVFSSIIEIQYVRFMSLTFPEFKYYYMGFYIHDNQKMSYKGDYSPYQLLCPITYNFVTVDERVKQIINKVVRNDEQNIQLAPQGMSIDQDMLFTNDIGQFIDKNIKLKYRNKNLKLSQINPQFFVPILTLLRSNLQVWGKQFFDIITITL